MKLSDTKKLTASAHNQNCEVMLNPKDFVHMAFLDRKLNVIVKWMPCYDMIDDANKYQLN